MSRLLARIMLAILMLPLSAVIYLLGMAWSWELRHRLGYYDEKSVLVLGGAAAWVFVAIYWYLLWRRSILWNTRRRFGTSISAAAAAAGGLLVGVCCLWIEDDFAYFMGSITAPALWLVGSVIVWRETPEERAARISGSTALVCPTCGYNLTGLTEPRCPECGSRFTLDELMRSQPGCAGAEIGG